jgi:hypothetical protein
MALLILAGCEQAERAIGGALPSRKAIAELPYQGDRPDAPPLAERGNAVFDDAAFAVSPDGKLVAASHRRGTAVWDTATDTIRFPLRDPKRKLLPEK